MLDRIPLAAPLLVAALAAAGAGCSVPVDVSFDEHEDFSRFRTWDWIPGSAIVVNASFEDEEAVEAQIGRGIERELEQLGLVFAPGSGELQIGATFTAVRDHEFVSTPGAIETLSSLHETPSFETQSVYTEMRVVDRCRVALYVRDRGTRQLIWQAAIRDRLYGGCRSYLDEVVPRLFERFPRDPEG